MKKLLLAILVTLVLIISIVLPAAAAAPEKAIPTPAGMIGEGRVIEIGEGSDISRRGNTTEIHKDGRLTLSVKDKTPIVPDYSGWVESSSDWNMGRLDSFTGNLVVPPGPAASGSCIFLFTAIEPSEGGSIMQPVLEWNWGSYQGWWISSWYGPLNGNYYYSTPTRVYAGDNISETITHSSAGWTIKADDLTRKKFSSIVTNFTGTSNLAVFAALEGYWLTGNSSAPGTTTFSNMTFKYKNERKNASWTPNVSLGTGLSGLNVVISSSSKVILRTAN